MVKYITRTGKYHIQKIKQILGYFLISQISGGNNEEPSSEITNVKNTRSWEILHFQIDGNSINIKSTTTNNIEQTIHRCFVKGRLNVLTDCIFNGTSERASQRVFPPELF